MPSPAFVAASPLVSRRKRYRTRWFYVNTRRWSNEQRNRRMI